MELTKPQVKALLEVISKDETRPVLCNLYIGRYRERTVAVATDGYHMAILDAPELTELEGKVIPRGEIVKWYKLANTKDRLSLTMADLAPIAGELDGTYPPFDKLVPEEKPAGIAQLAFNPRYIAEMQQLNNGYAIYWSLYGANRPMVGSANGNTYVVMPLKPAKTH